MTDTADITEIRLPFGRTRCFEPGWVGDLDGGPGLALWVYRGEAPGPRRPPRLFTESEEQAYADFEGFFLHVKELSQLKISVAYVDGRVIDTRECAPFDDADSDWGEQDSLEDARSALLLGVACV